MEAATIVKQLLLPVEATIIVNYIEFLVEIITTNARFYPEYIKAPESNGDSKHSIWLQLESGTVFMKWFLNREQFYTIQYRAIPLACRNKSSGWKQLLLPVEATIIVNYIEFLEEIIIRNILRHRIQTMLRST